MWNAIFSIFSVKINLGVSEFGKHKTKKIEENKLEIKIKNRKFKRDQSHIQQPNNLIITNL